MIKTLLLAAFSFFLFALPCPALELNKNLPHYIREMEFYYLKPRPEILSPLLDNLIKNNALSTSENRLMLASFFAELSRNGKLNLSDFIRQNNVTGKDARHMFAWAVHLSGIPKEDILLREILKADEKNLRSQIKRTPRKLLDWPLDSEKSVLQMYWTAFMANGNQSYPDAVIRQALKLAKPSGAGSRDKHNTSLAAAASLYDLVPAHKKVHSRVKASLNNKNEKEKKLLKMILHEEKS